MRHHGLNHLMRYWFFILPFQGGDWNYDDPKLWHLAYPQCGGHMQSPIALFTRDSDFYPHLHLHFYNYTKQLVTPVEILNNGYSADVGVRINEDGSLPFLTIGDSTERFEVQGVHFHWGSEGHPGSEHTIDGEKYDLEMHIVHMNSKYSTVDEARNSTDGFVVLGVLFDGVDFQPDSNHQTLFAVYNSLGSISEYNSTAELEGSITMSSFLPDLDTKDFFAYKGSLTTPPCSESVFWFVFSDVLPISFNDLRKFFNLRNSKGALLLRHYRPIQATNNRQIVRRRHLGYYN